MNNFIHSVRSYAIFSYLCSLKGSFIHIETKEQLRNGIEKSKKNDEANSHIAAALS